MADERIIDVNDENRFIPHTFNWRDTEGDGLEYLSINVTDEGVVFDAYRVSYDDGPGFPSDTHEGTVAIDWEDLWGWIVEQDQALWRAARAAMGSTEGAE